MGAEPYHHPSHPAALPGGQTGSHHSAVRPRLPFKISNSLNNPTTILCRLRHPNSSSYAQQHMLGIWILDAIGCSKRVQIGDGLPLRFSSSNSNSNSGAGCMRTWAATQRGRRRFGEARCSGEPSCASAQLPCSCRPPGARPSRGAPSRACGPRPSPCKAPGGATSLAATCSGCAGYALSSRQPGDAMRSAAGTSKCFRSLAYTAPKFQGPCK